MLIVVAEVNDRCRLNAPAGIIQIKAFFLVSDGSKLTPLEPSHYPSKLSSHSCYRNSESPGGGLRLSGFESKSLITFFFSTIYF